jgi:uncharacterized surface protein with fasciclin (FAS1) repeats
MMRIKLMMVVLAAATSLLCMRVAQAADLVDTMAATPDLSTLSAAIKAAGIGDTLKGKGPYTVFAPTDEAFKRLPANTMTNLMKPENKEQLVKLLTFHILAAKVTEKDMDGKMYKTKTLNGKEAEIDADDPGEGIRINKAKITKADITADNGVIHLINRVLLP